jgi:hypothetical protein
MDLFSWIIGVPAGLTVVAGGLYVAYIFGGWRGVFVLLCVFAYGAYQEIKHGRNIWAGKDTITILKDGKVKVYEEK